MLMTKYVAGKDVAVWRLLSQSDGNTLKSTECILGICRKFMLKCASSCGCLSVASWIYIVLAVNGEMVGNQEYYFELILFADTTANVAVIVSVVLIIVILAATLAIVGVVVVFRKRYVTPLVT
jgi:hypothetical protein